MDSLQTNTSLPAKPNTQPLKDKLDRLKKILTDCGRVMVALSGGVDSVFLTAFAHRLWGDERIATITASGPHFAPDEAAYANEFCRKLEILHETYPIDYVLPVIQDNPPDRCYICKREIFSALKSHAAERGYVIADGTNLDDMQDYRPGIRALQELEVRSPLKEAGLTKNEIRQALQELAAGDPVMEDALTIQPEPMVRTDRPEPDGAAKLHDDADPSSDIISCPPPMPIWEKPAFACLASRIPYGDQLTVEKLTSVYKAERFLRSIGFTQVRVRVHGDAARIEVLPEDRARFFNEIFMEQVSEAIRACGFQFAALDLNGYKMGNLNHQEENNVK